MPGCAQLTWIGIGLGLAAVQWLPAYEFMRLSVRSSLSYEELAGGLALRDLVQFLVPDVYTYWSPMYVGILPLALALVGAWGWVKRGSRDRRGDGCLLADRWRWSAWFCRWGATHFSIGSFTGSCRAFASFARKSGRSM